MKKLGCPPKLVDHDGTVWIARRADEINGGGIYVREEHASEKGEAGLWLGPAVIEKTFTKIGREQPARKIVQQGPWECGAAAFAMVTGERLKAVKRILRKFGWQNNDGGLCGKVMTKAARFMGYDVIDVKYSDIHPGIGNAVLTVPSLNYADRWHAVAWVDGQTLDPNTGRPGRFVYGTEYNPETIRASFAEVVVEAHLSESERKEYDREKARNEEIYQNYLKAKVVQQLNAALEKE